VPNSALITVTTSAESSVSFSAATDCLLETVSQKCAQPPSVDLETTAASGSSTITLNHAVAIPRPRAPGLPIAAAARRRGSETVRASAGS
jgi:hypothetical protein